MTRDTRSTPDDASVQSLVDALSVAIDRPVLLDDETLAPLAFSRQWEVDDVRRESILGRGANLKVRDALLSQGIATAEDVVHIRADPDLGMSERICMPVRDRSRPLGYLWLLDPLADLGGPDLELLRRAADEIAAQLVARTKREIPDDAPLLAALCSPEQETSEAAVAEARGRGLMLEDRVLLFLLAAREGADVDALAIAHRAARRLSVGHAIAGAAPEGAALVASLGDPVLRMLPTEDAAKWVQGVSGAAVLVGQSAVATLATLAEASRQAAIALRVGRAHPEIGTGAWETLGADRLVAQLPAIARRDIPERLAGFLRTEPELAETLAVFLDAAADVKATAEALSLHRTGVYYRLHRIEELTGLDLRRGDDRLLAHIAVRLRHPGADA
ncbi:MAG: helix-turn-helix domain-containing protein [Actinobacteria bacterium]|nr:helix-turn-helix domain-containing protein [Actinomycetota bacterium]